VPVLQTPAGVAVMLQPQMAVEWGNGFCFWHVGLIFRFS
jgi:hypothetical protein